MVGAFQIACPFRSVNALTQRPFSDEESTIQSSRNGAGGWKDEGQRERGGVGKEGYSNGGRAFRAFLLIRKPTDSEA